MCGFVGLVLPNSKTGGTFLTDELKNRLFSAGQKLTHRGPDEEKFWTDNNCAVVHKRLHIIGDRQEGKQPAISKNQRYVMAYNGAVYNFLELAKVLGIQTQYNKTCDTEIILEGFAKHKRSWFEKLNGMFSLALWDREKKELWLAQDRFGQKPLYYGWIDNKFIFASELKAIIPFLGNKKKPNYEALHHYLSLGYIPAPLSGFDKIFKMLPGTFLRLQFSNSNATQHNNEITSYLSQTNDEGTPKNRDQLKVMLSEKIHTAVKRCMIANRPLGTFLSGGIDSSAITAMTCQLSPQKVKTFSIGFEDINFDERVHARMVADQLGTDHNDLVLENRDVANTVQKLSNIYDEPFADSSAIPMTALTTLTKQSLTVALSGDGADELFLGYPRYAEMIRQEKLSKLPNAIYKIADSLGHLPYLNRLLNLTHKQGEHAAALYFPMVSLFSHRQKCEHYSNLMQQYNNTETVELLRDSFNENEPYITGAARADLNHYLPGDLMVKSDRAAMASSLEVRNPFLDNDVVSFAHSLHWSKKFYNNSLKAILKDSVAPLLPPHTIKRQKQGFSVPLSKWLNSELKTMLHDTLLNKDAFVQTIFSASYIEKLLTAHKNSIGANEHRLWALLTLELWAQNWLGVQSK